MNQYIYIETGSQCVIVLILDSVICPTDIKEAYVHKLKLKYKLVH
jgi:hypothetical protein